jgi:hypothetical protein
MALFTDVRPDKFIDSSCTQMSHDLTIYLHMEVRSFSVLMKYLSNTSDKSLTVLMCHKKMLAAVLHSN